MTTEILTIDMVTAHAAIVLKNKLMFGSRCLRKFDSNFGVEGAKIGDNIRLRLPVRYEATSGTSPAAQDYVQTQRPLQVSFQDNVRVDFTSKELSLDLQYFSEQVTEPAMAQLATTVDQHIVDTILGYTVDGVAYGGVSNLATPGAISATTGPTAWTGASLGEAATTVKAALQPLTQAQARIVEQGAPYGVDQNYLALSPGDSAEEIAALGSAFNPQPTISEQYKSGNLGDVAGATTFVSPVVGNFTAGSRVANAGTVDGSTITGAVVLNVQGYASGATFKKGDQFTIQGVHAINPLTRASTGKLKVFVVVSDATAGTGSPITSGDAALSIYPAIISSGQYQTVDALPAPSAPIQFAGAASVQTKVNLYYNRNAFAMAVAPLAQDLPGAEVSVASTEPQDGDTALSVRYVRQYQSTVDSVVQRYDILNGASALRPELATRLQS